VANLRSNYCSAGKANAAAGTRVWGVGEIPGDGVVAFFIEMVGGGVIGDITRIRLTAGGQTIIDVATALGDESCFSAFLARLSMDNYCPDWSADTHLEIPLYFPDVDENDDSRYLCQFPPGQAPMLELTTGAGGSGETIRVGWRR
jgi:hypothetical protein